VIGAVAPFEADDFSLLVSSPIEWSSIPNHPRDYERYFHLLFEPSSEQSIYQQQLPKDLQLREYLQDWLKDETIPIVLGRLSSARTVQVSGLYGNG
jgi:ATP-dependent Lhr-like helicase